VPASTKAPLTKEFVSTESAHVIVPLASRVRATQGRKSRCDRTYTYLGPERLRQICNAPLCSPYPPEPTPGFTVVTKSSSAFPAHARCRIRNPLLQTRDVARGAPACCGPGFIGVRAVLIP